MDPSSTFNKRKNSLIFEVFEIYLFNKSGFLIAENINNKNIYNQQYYKKVFPSLIKATSLLDKKNNNLINHNIYFIEQRKIMTVNIAAANVISLAVFSKETKSKLIYFFLLKITMAYLNYMKMHNCNTTYNIHSIIYESIFLTPIKNHFSLAIQEVFRRYSLYINNIHYKNYFLVDLCSNEIILSLESFFDLNKKDEIEMTIKNKLIWNEILYHAHNLKQDYIKKYNYMFQIENLQDFYAKIELKATYPRLIYMIKFLPLLGGIALIYEYAQNKMSRIDNETKFYQEFKIEYGYEYDEENNFKTKNDEFLLNEPSVLIHIHFFIIECLLCNLDNINFFLFNKYQKIYFSDEILQLINKRVYSNIKISQVTDIVKNPQEVHQLLEKIVNALYEEYIQNNQRKEQSKYSALINTQEKEELALNKSFFLSYPDSLYISKKFTLNSIFKTHQLENYINPNDISLNLSSDDETSFTDDIYQTLREKNQFNQYNDPYFYNRYHYANASVESRQLMDLLYDNVSISDKEVLLNAQKSKNNLLFFEPNDFSFNITDASSRRNISKNSTLAFNPYGSNNINNDGVMKINLNNYVNNLNFNNNNPNVSSNSSVITSLMKMPKMNRK